MSSTCPLCRQPGAHLCKQLYGTIVCRKCYNGFANRRQLGYFLDWLIFTPISMAVMFALAMVVMMVGTDQPVFDLIAVLTQWIVLPLLFFCKDGFSGRSPGKAIMGVQVVDRELHMPIGFGASLKRNLPLMIPLMPLIVAFLLMKGYRLGDGWAGTKVIWKKYATHPVFTGGASCENCQYDLTGNKTGTCPECGTAVPLPAQAPGAHPPTSPSWSPLPGMPPVAAMDQPPAAPDREAA